MGALAAMMGCCCGPPVSPCDCTGLGTGLLYKLVDPGDNVAIVGATSYDIAAGTAAGPWKTADGPGSAPDGAWDGNLAGVCPEWDSVITGQIKTWNDSAVKMGGGVTSLQLWPVYFGGGGPPCFWFLLITVYSGGGEGYWVGRKGGSDPVGIYQALNAANMVPATNEITL